MSKRSSGRSHPRCSFTQDEDNFLVDLVAQFGDDNWNTIASYMESRNPRQCKDRYTSYLSPSIKNDPYSEEEDNLLKQKYEELGPKWVRISRFFHNRTDISVKCRWAVLNRRDQKNKGKKLYKDIISQNEVLTDQTNEITEIKSHVENTESNDVIFHEKNEMRMNDELEPNSSVIDMIFPANDPIESTNWDVYNSLSLGNLKLHQPITGIYNLYSFD
ncbi:Myb-like DNA-binding domain containing protein [Tritrichomonas foetus]|uniref:Myb-like DNA-binding domain containing protein n=1 Tax=Tritrichomonas foetus TaxID=1144522 RepID=A0A1J4L227_9EUKA|nr:Myb-like DNA-binding domain containing protein [Tritrichomonas foetus]|eukprot:OHT15998.1 Myb-like DNA-binding domain containing protein [Tritrichomonas foetus]